MVGFRVIPCFLSHPRNSVERYSPPWSVRSCWTLAPVAHLNNAVKFLIASGASDFCRIPAVIANREKLSMNVIIYRFFWKLSTGIGLQILL